MNDCFVKALKPKFHITYIFNYNEIVWAYIYLIYVDNRDTIRESILLIKNCFNINIYIVFCPNCLPPSIENNPKKHNNTSHLFSLLTNYTTR